MSKRWDDETYRTLINLRNQIDEMRATIDALFADRNPPGKMPDYMASVLKADEPPPLGISVSDSIETKDKFG